MTYTAANYARDLGLDKRLVERLSEKGYLPVLEKKGASYYLERADLPDRDELIDLARQAYRDELKNSLRIIDKLSAEIESIRLDFRDALENGTDPVQTLGNDAQSLIAMRRSEGPLDSARRDLTMAVLDLFCFYEPLHLLDGSKRASGGVN